MLIILNNKSNLKKQEFSDYQKELSKINSNNNKIVLCPTYLNIPRFNLDNIILGSQDVSKQEQGAYTGEISAKALKEENVKYCIIGHSERRENNKETSKDISTKAKKLLKENIIPIICIGENLEIKKSNKYIEYLKKEITESIEGLTKEEQKKVIIAYEPIYSIGTGIIPTNNEIEEIINLINLILPNNKVIYGGSVNEKNIVRLRKIHKLDGYLLGGLSLKIEKIKNFIENLA